MKVAIVGYAVENQAVYRYWAGKGADITICDQNPAVELPAGALSQLGPNYIDNLDQFDVVVRTVGMHPSIITDRYPNLGSKLTTAVNIFFEECHTPIIGITGTKGKGTTSTLIHKILTAAGKNAILAGNIGTPMLDVLADANRSEYVVLELSSFQLYDLRHSPGVALCLMVVPEHLNWHVDFADYKQAKSNLFRYQNSDDVAIFNALSDSSREVASSSPAERKLTYAVAPKDQEAPPLTSVYVKGDAIYRLQQEVMKISEVALIGRHNLENVCAAIATTWDIIDGNTDVIRSVVSSFTGLEFRLQFIRELHDVKYYNDSFSTTPETAIAALRSFEQPKIAILGGSDKGIPFDELADEVIKSNVRNVLAIGDTGPIIASLLRDRGFESVITDDLTNMDTVVDRAKQLAQPGDIVLLSTGAASFGMFRDYKDRGNQFNRAVSELA